MGLKEELEIVRKLGDKNDRFFKMGLITIQEYSENNLLLINRLKLNILKQSQLDFIKDTIREETASVINFRLAMEILVNPN